MTIGNYIVSTTALDDVDRKNLLNYQNKLQDLASDFIDQDVENTLVAANVSLDQIKQAITNANTTAAKINKTATVLTLAAATAALGFAIFTGVSTGNYGGITGALSNLVTAAKPVIGGKSLGSVI